MKRFIILIVAIAALYAPLAAQNRLGAEVEVQEFEYQADSVKLSLEFDLGDLKLAPNESVVFEPKLFKGEQRESLPTLVVRRRGGAKAYQRAERLDNEKSLEAYNDWYGTPYKIIDNFGSQREQRVNYTLTLPYERWMVESQLYVDCSTCGCCSQEDEGALIPEGNRLLIDIPEVAPYHVSPLVELIKPEKVAIKRRDIAYSSALIFKVNSTYIDPNLERNREELASIDEMMQSVISDSDYTITKINITGFASPEGRYSSNMILSQGRARALERLLEQKYKSINPKLYSVSFGGENWDMLSKLLSKSDMADRDALLDIIHNISIDEGREAKLMNYKGGEAYRYMLKNIFPATRLVEVDVEYNIDAYDLDRIGELIDTKPQNLSLEEMYRLSESYEMSDSDFEKIFLTAVQIYPDDEVAQNNALVTEIRGGDVAAVEQVAALVAKDTESAELANSLGAYYMLSGEYDLAHEMLERAIELGSPRAEENMAQLNAKLDNLQQIRASEEFRQKIYGE